MTDKEGKPKFFGSQRDHNVCCMMTPDEHVGYISTDVIHKIITTQALAEELWKRVEVELNEDRHRRLLRQLLDPKDRIVDEDWARKHLDRITDYTKFLLKTLPLSSAEHDKETSLLKRKRDVD